MNTAFRCGFFMFECPYFESPTYFKYRSCSWSLVMLYFGIAMKYMHVMKKLCCKDISTIFPYCSHILSVLLVNEWYLTFHFDMQNSSSCSCYDCFRVCRSIARWHHHHFRLLRRKWHVRSKQWHHIHSLYSIPAKCSYCKIKCQCILPREYFGIWWIKNFKLYSQILKFDNVLSSSCYKKKWYKLLFQQKLCLCGNVTCLSTPFIKIQNEEAIKIWWSYKNILTSHQLVFALNNAAMFPHDTLR